MGILEEVLQELEEKEVEPASLTNPKTGTKPRARSRKAATSTKALEGALEALEPGILGANEEPVEAAREISKLDPVERPNGQKYHPRLLAGKPDVSALKELRQAGVAVLLSGYPGCGKTALVEAAFNGEVITFAGHGEAEIGDLVGTYTQKPDGSFQWEDGPLVTAMKNGKVLFVDDATLTPSGVLARLYPAMDGRATITLTEHEGETIKAQDGFYVVGAHNPGVPGAVLSEALASRFSVHLEVPSDLNLARRLGVDASIISIARSMQLKRSTGEVMWAPEMRELLAYTKIKNILGVAAAVENLASICPERDREVFIPLLAKRHTNAKPLSLEDAP